MFKARLARWGFSKKMRDTDWQALALLHKQRSRQYQSIGYPQYPVPGVATLRSWLSEELGIQEPANGIKSSPAADDNAPAEELMLTKPEECVLKQRVLEQLHRSEIQEPANDIRSSPTANNNAPAQEFTSDNAEESPLYVNAKQFHRILKQRVARQRLEEQLRLTNRRDLGNWSSSATRKLDILSEAATPTKPLPLTPLTLNKNLPIGIKGKKLNASADTGSDECGMPKDIADQLGLKVRCASSDIKEFEIGNGRKIKSIGRTTVDCSFWNEPGKKLRCVFYVFERLIVPLIMGRDFLERTDTLTQHQDRLVDRAPRTGPCRVMHLSRPKRRMRCYIDSDLVEANPDTGAEMELVSLDFIKRKGYAVDTPDAAHEVVQFVDGSTARTQGQVTIKFEAYGDAFQEAVPSKARYRTFYVLDGLTTDILLGEDLLYSINAFTEHASSFVDLDDFGMPVELKGIVWLDRAEQRLARIFGGDLPGSSATSALGSAGKRQTIRHFPL
jgi:hypothetical protein